MHILSWLGKMEHAKETTTVTVTAIEVPPDADIEILGRQRPTVFSTFLDEVGFCSAMLTSIVMAVSLRCVAGSPQKLMLQTGIFY
jgi:hypothetical protein